MSAFAMTKTQKYRHAKYTCQILAPLYSCHTNYSMKSSKIKQTAEGKEDLNIPILPG